MTFLLYLSYLFYPFFSGWKDAVLWSKKGDLAYSWDEHLIFTGERIGFASAVIATWWINPVWWAFLATGLCGIASFFFFHNGMYYLGRKWIDNTYLGFFSDTKGNHTSINVPVKIRVGLFIISICIVITVQIICSKYHLV